MNYFEDRKVVIISNLYPPENIGGYEIGISWVCDEIQNQKALLRIYFPRKFFVFSNSGKKSLFHKRFDKKMHSIGTGWIGHPNKKKSIPLIPTLIYTAILQNLQMRRISKFADVVLFANPRGIPFNFPERLAKVLNKNNIPYFIYVSDRWVETWPSSDPLFGLKIRSQKILGEKYRQLYLMKILNYFFNKFISQNEIVHLQPNAWISCSYFIESTIRKRMGNDITTKVLHWRVPFKVETKLKKVCPTLGRCITFASNITAEKGILMLIDALSQINQDAHLHIFGGGYNLSVETFQERKNFKVVIINEGKKSPIEVSKFLSSYKTILAVPSIWPEPFSIVATQAVVANCPLVITPSGGSSEWKTLSSKGIIVTESTSAKHFAFSLSQASENPDLETRKEMSNFSQFVEDIFNERPRI